MDTSNIYLEVTGEPNLLARPNEPLSRVILVPSDRIPVVHRELVVEVVVTFAQSDESDQEMIARGRGVVIRKVAECVSEGVYRKCSLVSAQAPSVSSIARKRKDSHDELVSSSDMWRTPNLP